MSCVRCDASDPYYTIDRQKEAQDTRDAAWKGPLGTTHKVGGYFLNVGIVCVLAGTALLAISYFGKIFGNLQLHQLLKKPGIFSLLASIPCIGLTITLESLSIRQVKKIVCKQLGDGSHNRLPDTFQVNEDFAQENAPQGENVFLLKIMDRLAHA